MAASVKDTYKVHVHHCIPVAVRSETADVHKSHQHSCVTTFLTKAYVICMKQYVNYKASTSHLFEFDGRPSKPLTSPCLPFPLP